MTITVGPDMVPMKKAGRPGRTCSGRGSYTNADELEELEAKVEAVNPMVYHPEAVQLYVKTVGEVVEGMVEEGRTVQGAGLCFCCPCIPQGFVSYTSPSIGVALKMAKDTLLLLASPPPSSPTTKLPLASLQSMVTLPTLPAVTDSLASVGVSQPLKGSEGSQPRVEWSVEFKGDTPPWRVLGVKHPSVVPIARRHRVRFPVCCGVKVTKRARRGVEVGVVGGSGAEENTTPLGNTLKRVRKLAVAGWAGKSSSQKYCMGRVVRVPHPPPLPLPKVAAGSVTSTRSVTLTPLQSVMEAEGGMTEALVVVVVVALHTTVAPEQPLHRPATLSTGSKNGEPWMAWFIKPVPGAAVRITVREAGVPTAKLSVELSMAKQEATGSVKVVLPPPLPLGHEKGGSGTPFKAARNLVPVSSCVS